MQYPQHGMVVTIDLKERRDPTLAKGEQLWP